MNKESLFSGAVLLISGGILLAMAPDKLSMMIIGVMLVLMVLGFFLSVVPSLSFNKGFLNAVRFIRDTKRVQSSNMWVTVSHTDALFRNDTLDGLFNDYKEKIRRRAKESSRSLYDVTDVINEFTLETKTWQRLCSQIPSMLTALGILGTFMGLISGISAIRFSSVDVAVEGVQTLLNGIGTAFYTSVAGVILSLVYTVVTKFTWNLMLQSMDRFYHDYHMYVSDPAEVRDKLLRNMNVRDILDRLDKLISLQRTGDYADEE